MQADDLLHPSERPLFSPHLEAAVRLAARGHYHQFRKRLPDDPAGDTPQNPLPEDAVPYVSHLIATMCILARLGADEDVLAAALLHDYLEDVHDPQGGATIRRELGPRVLELVKAVTEDKRPGRSESETWEVRKREQVESLEGMPRDAVLIKAADVLHNLVSLIADLNGCSDGDSVWARFNAGPERQMWYFEAVADGVRDRLGEHPLARELDTAIARVRSLTP